MWLVFYAPIMLQGLMPQKYLRNLGFFINAVTMSLQDAIPVETIEDIDKNFQEFVKGFEELFEKKHMNYNIHLLRHIPNNIKNWGPMHASSTFFFEDENRLLMLFKKSHYKVQEQIINKKLFFQNSALLLNENFMTEETKVFCETRSGKQKLKNFTRTDENCVLVGKGKNVNISEEELQCLRFIGIDTRANFAIKSFDRMWYKGFRLTSVNYKRAKKTLNCCCEIGDEIAVIRNILFLQIGNIQRTVVLASTLNLKKNLKFLDVTIPHIFYCEDKFKELRAFDICDFKKPAILFIDHETRFVLRIPKGCLASER